MKNLLFLSLIVTFFLLHFEGARMVLFGVPVYWVEIGVIVSAGAFLFVQKGRGDTGKWAKGVEWGKWGIFFLLFGVISSMLVALSNHSICPLSHEGLLRALGILKSWFVFPMLFGWTLFYASRTYFSREKLIFVFLVSFLPISILSLTGWLFGSGMTYDGRLAGMFNSPNALAMHLTPAIILSWYFFRKEKSRISATHYSLLTTLFFFLLLFLTRSYSAWIAVTAGILVFEFFRVVIPAKAGIQSPPAKYNLPTNKICSVPTESKWNLDPRFREDDKKKKSILKYGILFLFAILLIFSQWNSPRFEHFFDPDSRSSFASRLMIWQSAGNMIANSPFFGVGPGNFQSCYLAYQKHFPPYLEWSVPEPHNIFLAFWLGSGIIGLLGFGFLVFWWLRTIFQRIRKEKNLPVLVALAAIMIAILIHGLVDTPYWRMSLAYIFWIVFFAGITREK